MNEDNLIAKLEKMGFEFWGESEPDWWEMTICNGKQSYTINSYTVYHRGYSVNSYTVYQHGTGITKKTKWYETGLQWIIDMETMTTTKPAQAGTTPNQ